MRTLIFTLSIIFVLCNPFFADASQSNSVLKTSSYKYFTFGLGPIGIADKYFTPSVGIGFRKNYLNHGFDASLNFTTGFQIHQIHADFLYHFIPNPSNPWYLGVGVAGSYFILEKDTSFALAPDFVIGKELKNNKFLELHVQAPTWFFDKGGYSSFLGCGSMKIPLTYLKYGIAF